MHRGSRGRGTRPVVEEWSSVSIVYLTRGVIPPVNRPESDPGTPNLVLRRKWVPLFIRSRLAEVGEGWAGFLSGQRTRVRRTEQTPPVSSIEEERGVRQRVSGSEYSSQVYWINSSRIECQKGKEYVRRRISGERW